MIWHKTIFFQIDFTSTTQKLLQLTHFAHIFSLFSSFVFLTFTLNKYMSEATWYVSTFHQINSSSFDKETAQFSTPFHTHPQTNTSDGSSTYSPNDCFDLLRVPGCYVVLQKEFSFFVLKNTKFLKIEK